MGSPGPFGDPKIEMRQAVRDIREALHALREGVITAVMRRNRAHDEVTKLEQLLVDLDAKADVADKLKNPKLAGELREEHKVRAGELEKARQLVARLTAAAESAKINLPEDEARLLQRARELQTQLIETAGTAIETGTLDVVGTEANALFERARNKTRDLQNEASARTEVATVRGGESKPPQLPALTAGGMLSEETAERMLAALEARIGGASTARLESDLTPATVPAESPTALDAPPLMRAGGEPRTAAGETVAPAVWPSHRIQLAAAKGEKALMDPTQRVRIAAIGTGNIFRGAHLPAYPDIAQAQLVAFCDPDRQAQQAVVKRYNELMDAKLKQAKERGDQETAERVERDRAAIQICEDIREVIDTIKPDLVDICTQPMLHAPLSIQALEAGLHVMCEKPISRSWLESQRLIETVRRTGKFYQHNENWLWDPDWYTAKKLVDSGAIGEPILMFLATAHGGPEGAGRFWNSDYGGGGALLDNGIHAIGASWYVSGLDKRPTYVKAAQPFGMSIRMPNRILDGRFQKVRVDDDAHILIRFENPETLAWTTAHVEGSWSHRDSPDTVVIGTTGKILFVSEENRRYAVVMDAYDREARRIEVSGPTWQHWPSSFYGEILNMVESVRNNVPSISDANFGAECSAIVGASYLSERDGRRAVSVDEFKSFARGFAARYPDDPAAADNALVDALLSAVRK
jgi:predicted dehydrogenase/phage shock protein A